MGNGRNEGKEASQEMADFFSEEWAQALVKVIDRSASYRDAAKHWEGDLLFVVDRCAAVPQGIALYMDLWHGECREAFVVNGPLDKTPAFTVEGPLPVWRRVIERKLDPIQALMLRQLRMKGNMIKVLQMPRAAMELVKCCTFIPTTWP